MSTRFKLRDRRNASGLPSAPLLPKLQSISEYITPNTDTHQNIQHSNHTRNHENDNDSNINSTPWNKQAMDQYNSYITGLLSNCELLTNLITTQQSTIQQQKLQYDHQQSVINCLNNKINDSNNHQTKLIQVTTELTELKRPYNQLQLQYNELLQSHKTQCDSYNILDAQYQSCQLQCTQWEKKYNELQQSYDVLLNQHEQIKPGVSEPSTLCTVPSIDSLQLHDNHPVEYNQLNNTIIQLRQQIDVLDNINNRHSTQIIGLQNNNNELQHKNIELDQSNQQCNTQIKLLTQQYADTQGKYDKLYGTYNKYMNKYDKLLHEYNTINSVHTDVQYQLDECQQSKLQLQSELDTIETRHRLKIDELMKTIVELRIQSNSRLHELHDIQQQLRDTTQSSPNTVSSNKQFTELQQQYDIHMAQCTSDKQSHTEQYHTQSVQINQLQSEIELMTDKCNQLSQQHDITVNQSNHTVAELKSTTATLELYYKSQLTELNIIINKLLLNEKSTELSLTCTICMKLYDQPVTVTLCGHSYCLRCITSGHIHGRCTLCNDQTTAEYQSNALLDDIVSKYIYRQQQLHGIKLLTDKHAAPTIDTSSSAG